STKYPAASLPGAFPPLTSLDPGLSSHHQITFARRNSSGKPIQEIGMSGDNIVIVGAARTAVGSFNGAFVNTPAHDLGAVAIKAALERAKVDPSEVDEVILGQILTAGQGQNPARQAAMAAGIPQEKTAWGLNQ